VADLEHLARNRQVALPGHFSTPVRVEGVEDIGADLLLVRVRTQQGLPAETTIGREELSAALDQAETPGNQVPPEELFRWIERHRIALAFAHDPYFAVSLSGVRGLPHQVEAVYRHMLPQPRLRFVLADDPGAGKTIMAGLLVKELMLRGVVERVLVVAPAPLTVQWQDELFDKFDERFELVGSHQVRYQLGGSPWQQHSRVITSIDFAKRDEVLPDMLRAPEWDLVIVDEAHKASAATYGDEIARTRRYSLVEQLSANAQRLLLMTATPHSGDEGRFVNFLALLDPDQFASADLVKRQIGVPDNPYFLRRQKEDLVDERGGRLFVERYVSTQPFTLSPAEIGLYEAVTDYINAYLGAAGGRRGNAIALARTVLQRRLASSLGAIRSSLGKRAARLTALADELEALPPAQLRARLSGLQRIDAADEETGDEDTDEEAQDEAALGVSAAAAVTDLRAEVSALTDLVRHADRTIASGEEQKLAALRECLATADFADLRDGRGKLLVFTEHRDTLEYLVRHLREWGYSVCTIHGGHAPAERKRIQQEFRLERQICVATEAAGEGINLQFCHLMINYDLPWNPVRLEQRMGRIHRIGQSSEVVVINFCATNTIEGQLLHRLHLKLEDMRAALQGRVYDVIGDLLALNHVDFERLVKETLSNPRRLESSIDAISALSADALQRYEHDIGVAQATRSVNLDWVRGRDWASEERRLMPEYVEKFFLDAAARVGARVERRADQLYRLEHVPAALRSDQLESVKRLGRPATEYRKLTFRKEHRERAEHEDAVLCSPGHRLFAAVAEAMERDLVQGGVPGAAAAFVDPAAAEPYRIHFCSFEVVGEAPGGQPETAHAELVSVVEEPDGELRLGPADVLHDLTPDPKGAADSIGGEGIREVANWVRAHVQASATDDERCRRREQAAVRTDYLREAFDAQQAVYERRYTDYDERVASGDETYRLQREEQVRRVKDLRVRREAKLAAFAHLGIVRPGPVTYLGGARVAPPARPEDDEVRTLRPDPAVEAAAMHVAMEHERSDGWEPLDVSARRDGTGFDVRSTRVHPQSGAEEERRIEVKGRSSATGDVGLYRTEWYAAQRFRRGFWLYVVYDALGGQPRLVRVQDPWGTLQGVREIAQVTGYRVPGPSIEAACGER